MLQPSAGQARPGPSLFHMVGSVRSARSVPSKQRYAAVDVMDNGGRDDGAAPPPEIPNIISRKL